MKSNIDGKQKFTKKPTTQKKKKNTHQASLPSFLDLQRQQICDVAARIIHEDGVRDYHRAKLRAGNSLQIKSNTFLPTNEEIERALKSRLELFESHNLMDNHKTQQLAVAMDMLQILDDYHARLAGGLINGIAMKNLPIEIHSFCDCAELVVDELNWRGISSFGIEKRYRYTNNEYINVPLFICQLDNCDIEISVFKEKELHRSPICPTNGKIFKRLSLKELP